MTNNQQIQIDFNAIFNTMFLMFFMFMMFKMMDKTLAPSEERPRLPPVEAPPGYRPLKRGAEVSPPTEAERLQEKKETLEDRGREMARKAGAEFVELVEGWQGKYATPMYQFKDPATGQKIVARDLEDLKWKLSVLHYKTEHHSLVCSQCGAIIFRTSEKYYDTPKGIFCFGCVPMEYKTAKYEKIYKPVSGSEHHSMWLTSEQREPLEKKYGAIAVRWAEEATRPGDIKGVETAAEYYYKKVKEALGLGHLSPELTEEQIMKLREVLGLPADIAQILKIHRETGYVP